jgi:hypothetical protein
MGLYRKSPICRTTLELLKELLKKVLKTFNVISLSGDILTDLADDPEPPIHPYPCLLCGSILNKCSSYLHPPTTWLDILTMSKDFSSLPLRSFFIGPVCPRFTSYPVSNPATASGRPSCPRYRGFYFCSVRGT